MKIKEIENIKNLKEKEVEIMELSIQELKNLKEKTKKIKDLRMSKKCTYKIWDIVCVTLIACLANCNEWDEIRDFAIINKKWLKTFLLLTGGIPSSQTYERVISLIDPKELNNICVEFCKELIQINKYKKDFYHFDGKVENGSGRKRDYKSGKVKPLNVLNVYSDCLGMCIDQEAIEEKTNEITAMPIIIKRLNLKNVICTWDALNTQKEVVKAVINQGGDYVGALKGNQGSFYEDIKDYFDEDRLLIIKSGYEGGYQLTKEKSHSSIITYEYYQTEKIKWYEDYNKWEKLRSIGVVVKTIENKEKKKIVEKRYYISSLLLNIELFAMAIRKHWNVENKLHWQMDFTFKSDYNTTVNKKALLNLQIVKKFALSILNHVKDEYKCSLKRIRFRTSMNTAEEIHKIFYLLNKKNIDF